MTMRLRKKAVARGEFSDRGDYQQARQVQLLALELHRRGMSAEELAEFLKRNSGGFFGWDFLFELEGEA